MRVTGFGVYDPDDIPDEEKRLSPDGERAAASERPGRRPPDPDLQDQGVLAEGCPHCRVLYPNLSPCPVCKDGSDIRPAQMMDREGVHRTVRAAAEAYDGSRERFDDLVELLFVHAPESLVALEEHGRVTLDRLREDDGIQTGRSEADVLARLGEPAVRTADVWEYPAPGPANHFRTTILLHFQDGRVVRQSERRTPEPCDPLGPFA